MGFCQFGLKFRQLGPGLGFDIQAWCVRIKGRGMGRYLEKKFGFCGNLRSFSGARTSADRRCVSPLEVATPAPIQMTGSLNFGIKFERIQSLKFWYKYEEIERERESSASCSESRTHQQQSLNSHQFGLLHFKCTHNSYLSSVRFLLHVLRGYFLTRL